MTYLECKTWTGGFMRYVIASWLTWLPASSSILSAVVFRLMLEMLFIWERHGSQLHFTHGWWICTNKHGSPWIKPTSCVIAAMSKSWAVVAKLLSWFLSSGLRRVMVDRVMSASSNCCWICSVCCVWPTEKEVGEENYHKWWGTQK